MTESLAVEVCVTIIPIEPFDARLLGGEGGVAGVGNKKAGKLVPGDQRDRPIFARFLSAPARLAD